MSVHLPWHTLAIFGSFRAFKYNIMYEHRRRQSLKLNMFFRIKFLLYKQIMGGRPEGMECRKD